MSQPLTLTLPVPYVYNNWNSNPIPMPNFDLSLTLPVPKADILNAVAEFAGMPQTCPPTSYTKQPASSCVDAQSFGSLNGQNY